jgi:cupin fold WbuC family metalloprotein
VLNALQSDSYLRPHRHLFPTKSETILALEGSIRFAIFGSGGMVTNHLLSLQAATGDLADWTPEESYPAADPYLTKFRWKIIGYSGFQKNVP